MTREAPGPETLQVILQLLEAGKTETVYRNLYLQRARTFFASLLPYPEYLRLKQEEVSIDTICYGRTDQWESVEKSSGVNSVLRSLAGG